jgi:hypothetical protein
VRDLSTDGEQVVGDLELRLGALHYRSGLTWAENDLIFGTGGARRGLLAQLELT